ncbi:hypothetical protein CSOJ01_11123 [Colletotrichum sojae]|uniref:Uncharacterized protein n=1 Tax=Colletotrichum sojae TaxID=2175907 RepID=A0A8H6MP49_9PEZI|nr:hypothetical protein CSOJ01_11123 [Colletotrichum sojae]
MRLDDLPPLIARVSVSSVWTIPPHRRLDSTSILSCVSSPAPRLIAYPDASMASVVLSSTNPHDVESDARLSDHASHHLSLSPDSIRIDTYRDRSVCPSCSACYTGSQGFSGCNRWVMAPSVRLPEDPGGRDSEQCACRCRVRCCAALRFEVAWMSISSGLLF